MSLGGRARGTGLRVWLLAWLVTVALAGCGAPARHDPGLALSAPDAPAASLGQRAAPDTLASLAAGAGTTCVTTTSGAGYCWGQLGASLGTAYRIRGEDGLPAAVASLVPWASSLCAITLAGDVWCSRDMTDGWLDSLGAPAPAPGHCEVDVCIGPLPLRGALPRGPLRDAGAGPLHACVLAPGGAAFCWGRNHMGQLGNGRWAPDSTGSAGSATRAPTAVVGELRFAQLSVGEDLTCGVTIRDRSLYCWGYGQSGQAGDSTVTTYCDGRRPYFTKPCSTAVPARVLPESLPESRVPPQEVRFERVDAGMRLACAVSADGGAWCWGSNYRCALGRCRAADSPRARRIQVPGRVVEIGAGYWHACARTADRRVFCWGDNSAGQLGSLVTANAGPDGYPPDYRDTTSAAARDAAWRGDPCFLGGRCSPAAVEVSPGRRWAALSVGTGHACALAEDDGGVYCWGGGDSTVLGTDARLVLCENRSATWKDVRCQPTPVRVPGLPRLAARPVRVTTSGRALPRSDSTRVLASRREVRVVFPRDTARAWGWSASTAPDYRPEYYWGMTVGGIDGPRTLRLEARRPDSLARDFPSLDSLVAAGHVARCPDGMMSICDESGVTASVDGGRVVIVLRDSAQIVELFGMRPASVQTWQSTPEEPYDFRTRSVSVEYVEPQIPQPDAAFRAEAARRLRAHEEAIHWNVRSIRSDGAQHNGALWLVVGDSAEVRVEETHCTYDVCSGGREVVSDSGWRMLDSGIARLRVPSVDTAQRWFVRSGPAARVVARRPGRTTLRIRGLRGPADTMPSRSPVPRELSLAVVVTPPIARVQIGPHPDTVAAYTSLELRIRVVDRTGRVLDGAPVAITGVWGEGSRGYTTSTRSRLVVTGPPGGRLLIASFGGRADTTHVHVVAGPPR